MYIHVSTYVQCCILILVGEEEKRSLEVNTFQMLAKEDKVKERATSYPAVPLEPCNGSFEKSSQCHQKDNSK